jgi:hypothetical protein
MSRTYRRPPGPRPNPLRRGRRARISFCQARSPPSHRPWSGAATAVVRMGMRAAGGQRWRAAISPGCTCVLNPTSEPTPGVRVHQRMLRGCQMCVKSQDFTSRRKACVFRASSRRSAIGYFAAGPTRRRVACAAVAWLPRAIARDARSPRIPAPRTLD